MSGLSRSRRAPLSLRRNPSSSRRGAVPDIESMRVKTWGRSSGSAQEGSERAAGARKVEAGKGEGLVHRGTSSCY